MALLYVKPNADFSVYTHFVMLDAYVAFKKNWQRKTKVAGRRISNRDVERIKGEAAKLLHENFKKQIHEVGGTDLLMPWFMLGPGVWLLADVYAYLTTGARM